MAKTVQIPIELFYDLMLYFDESDLGKTPDREERIRQAIKVKEDAIYRRETYKNGIPDK